MTLPFYTLSRLKQNRPCWKFDYIFQGSAFLKKANSDVSDLLKQK